MPSVPQHLCGQPRSSSWIGSPSTIIRNTFVEVQSNADHTTGWALRRARTDPPEPPQADASIGVGASLSLLRIDQEEDMELDAGIPLDEINRRTLMGSLGRFPARNGCGAGALRGVNGDFPQVLPSQIPVAVGGNPTQTTPSQANPPTPPSSDAPHARPDTSVAPAATSPQPVTTNAPTVAPAPVVRCTGLHIMPWHERSEERRARA